MLANTKKMLEQKRELEYLDTYAMCVSIGGKREVISSPNADGDTLFDCASMGKVLVTTTLTLKAVGMGLISLDDTLEKFFPFAPADKKDITVRQCLTHTSGMANNVPVLGPLSEVGADNIARQIFILPKRFPSGEGCMYCCSGMWLMGLALEKVYGMPLEEAFKKYIAGPLGYTRSRFNIAVDEPNSAVSYTREKVGNYPSPWDDHTVCALGTSHGSGGQFFTVNDISKYCEAVLQKSEKLYAKELFDLAEKPYARCSDGSEGVPEMRGLGWTVVDESYVQGGKLLPVGTVGHIGWTGTRFYISREKNMYVILLTNATRWLRRRHGWRSFDSRESLPLWWDVLGAARRDLVEQGLY